MRNRCQGKSAVVVAACAGSLLVLAACGTTVPLTVQAGSLQASDGLGSSTATASTAATGVPQVGDGGQGPATQAGSAPQAHQGASAATGAVGTAPIGGTVAQPSATAAVGVPGKSSKPVTPATVTQARPSPSKTVAKTGVATTTPISIGLVYVAPSAQQQANSALGASTSATLNAKTTLDAFVKQINATGGLSGRMLAPVDVTVSNGDATEEQTDCDDLTQDNHVSVVIDSYWGGAGNFASCLQQADVVDIDVTNETDAASLSKLTLHYSLLRMSLDRAYGDVVTNLAQTGYVTSKNKIGVLMDTCTNSIAAYNNTVLPDFQRLGLDRVSTVSVTCNGSTSATSTQIASAVLTFRGSNVDRVMIISTSEQAGLLLFGLAAGTQGYNPGYMLSSQAEASAVAPLLPASQAANLNGVGNLPVFDVTSPTNPAGPAEASCVSDMQKQQITPSNSDDFYYIYLGCTGFRLLGAALAADGGVSTASALSAAISGLGSFTSPGIVGDSATITNARHDAPSAVRTFAYQQSCSCMAYTSAPMPA